jgi:hypothetical protein
VTSLAQLQARRLREHRLEPSAPLADAASGIDFVVDTGVVMASGKSSLPTLTEAIVGHAIKGSWMVGADGQRIYDLWNEIDARPEVTSAPLVQGKQVYLRSTLNPALSAVKGDAKRRTRAVDSLKPRERQLYDAILEAGELRADEWAQVSLLTASQVRTARTRLAALFLVAGEELHTDAGYHTVILRPLAPEPGDVSFTDATNELLAAAIRSCVLADAKEVRKWNDWSSAALDALLDDGAVVTLEEFVVCRELLD